MAHGATAPNASEPPSSAACACFAPLGQQAVKLSQCDHTVVCLDCVPSAPLPCMERSLRLKRLIASDSRFITLKQQKKAQVRSGSNWCTKMRVRAFGVATTFVATWDDTLLSYRKNPWEKLRNRTWIVRKPAADTIFARSAIKNIATHNRRSSGWDGVLVETLIASPTTPFCKVPAWFPREVADNAVVGNHDSPKVIVNNKHRRSPGNGESNSPRCKRVPEDIVSAPRHWCLHLSRGFRSHDESSTVMTMV